MDDWNTTFLLVFSGAMLVLGRVNYQPQLVQDSFHQQYVQIVLPYTFQASPMRNHSRFARHHDTR